MAKCVSSWQRSYLRLESFFSLENRNEIIWAKLITEWVRRHFLQSRQPLLTPSICDLSRYLFWIFSANQESIAQFNERFIIQNDSRYIKNETQNGKILSSLCPVAKRKKNRLEFCFEISIFKTKFKIKLVWECKILKKSAIFLSFHLEFLKTPFWVCFVFFLSLHFEFFVRRFEFFLSLFRVLVMAFWVCFEFNLGFFWVF